LTHTALIIRPTLARAFTVVNMIVPTHVFGAFSPRRIVSRDT
jgi:hypothetical protein